MGLRAETRVRARAVQLLYAWEVRDRPTVDTLADDLLKSTGGRFAGALEAEALAQRIAADQAELDDEIEVVVEGWRLERLGTVERCILRLALHEMRQETAPPKVVITEAVQLARWFGGEKAPGFVNGVLDTLARRLGRL